MFRTVSCALYVFGRDGYVREQELSCGQEESRQLRLVVETHGSYGESGEFA